MVAARSHGGLRTHKILLLVCVANMIEAQYWLYNEADMSDRINIIIRSFALNIKADKICSGTNLYPRSDKIQQICNGKLPSPHQWFSAEGSS